MKTKITQTLLLLLLALSFNFQNAGAQTVRGEVTGTIQRIDLRIATSFRRIKSYNSNAAIQNIKSLQDSIRTDTALVEKRIRNLKTYGSKKDTMFNILLNSYCNSVDIYMNSMALMVNNDALNKDFYTQDYSSKFQTMELLKENLLGYLFRQDLEVTLQDSSGATIKFPHHAFSVNLSFGHFGNSITSELNSRYPNEDYQPAAVNRQCYYLTLEDSVCTHMRAGFMLSNIPQCNIDFVQNTQTTRETIGGTIAGMQLSFFYPIKRLEMNVSLGINGSFFTAHRNVLDEINDTMITHYLNYSLQTILTDTNYIHSENSTVYTYHPATFGAYLRAGISLCIIPNHLSITAAAAGSINTNIIIPQTLSNSSEYIASESLRFQTITLIAGMKVQF